MKRNTRILVIEDDPATAEEIATELEARGHEVQRVDDGLLGLEAASRGQFDLLTLDRMLPGMDGTDLVERLRAQGITTPVLMISALSDVDERIAGLRAGGDDYLVKPFAPAEMAVRVEVLLRRASPNKDSVIEVGPLRLDLINREVTLDGLSVKLVQMEFKLLEFFVRNAGEIVNRHLIFEQVWGYTFDPGANLINVHIGRLRRKLERPGAPPLIVTVKGEGYRLDVR